MELSELLAGLKSCKGRELKLKEFGISYYSHYVIGIKDYNLIDLVRFFLQNERWQFPYGGGRLHRAIEEEGPKPYIDRFESEMRNDLWMEYLLSHSFLVPIGKLVCQLTSAPVAFYSNVFSEYRNSLAGSQSELHIWDIKDELKKDHYRRLLKYRATMILYYSMSNSEKDDYHLLPDQRANNIATVVNIASAVIDIAENLIIKNNLTAVFPNSGLADSSDLSKIVYFPGIEKILE